MPDTPMCLCGSGDAYVRCCGRYLDTGEWPVTAEDLMRSRYTAYALARADYLQRTWHVSTRPVDLALGENASMKWLGLTILDTRDGGALDDTGVVEFVARYKSGGKAERLHEISRFVKQDGQWFYVDGDTDAHG
jgi:SEC-C motif-containing protein